MSMRPWILGPFLLLVACSSHEADEKAPASSPGGSSTGGGSSSTGGGSKGGEANQTSGGGAANPSGGKANDASSGGGANQTSSGGAASQGGDGGADVPGGVGGALDSVPYANVVSVTASGEPGSYVFSVSVESADVDCSQFANWWEILDEQGALIYRRILRHSHTDANGTSDADAPGNTFTRTSEGTVDVEKDQLLLVRAHMNTGGYRGDVMRGTVEDGFEVASDLPPDFAAEVEFEEPLSDECDF